MRKTLLAIVFAFFSLNLYAVYEVGDPVSNLCWKDVQSKSVCLEDYPGTVRVLIYNTGWCPSCNQEMGELAPRAKEFTGQAVTFLSLSAEGFAHGSAPDATFLASWKQKYNIPFVVAASPKDAGKSFFTPPLYIPNVSIVGKDGKLTYKEVAPDVDVIFEQVRKALQ